jgi:hypothetical protein
VRKLEASVEDLATDVGGLQERVDEVEEAATSPAPHASPPSHPSPKAPEKADPRQTDLEEHIARARNGAGAAIAHDDGDDEDHDERAEEAGGQP